jgi:tetratricopeptide (TPR) repeat protein
MSTQMSRAKILAVLVAAAFLPAISSAVCAQTPVSPTPPVAPAPAVEPIPPLGPIPPRPPVAPLPPLPPLLSDFDFDSYASTPHPMVNVNVDDFAVDVDIDAIVANSLAVTKKAMSRIDFNGIAAMSLDAATRALDNIDIEGMVAGSLDATNKALKAVRARVAPGISVSSFESQFGGLASTPAASWASADPADSLYRIAREALNRGEYRRASQIFDQIALRYPNSVYAADSRYWKAFALYRIGAADDLREALRSLETGTGRYSASLQVDAPTLATRISGALAARGDARAAALVAEQASQTGRSCDREDIAVRIEALNSLGQMDPESTTPMLKRLLDRKDDCSASLRRAALFLLAKRGDADAFSLLSNAAKNDPDLRIRADAIRWLARLPGDQAIPTLEEIVRTGDNSMLQEAAIDALGNSDSPRARQSIRSLVERTDLAESLRAAALQSIDPEHVDDGGAYLRGIYPRLGTPRLQLADVRAIARIGGPDNDQWLLSLVSNNSASLDVRRMALGYAGRSNINITELVKMYDSMADRPLREQLIALYARRTEPQATDKLIDIAKNGTDPELRRLAISNLSRKNDPRTKKLLLEIIDK